MALDYGYTIQIQSNGTSDPSHTPTNQWQRKLSGQPSFEDLDGETSTTYKVTTADQSSQIRLKQSFSGSFAYSNALEVTSATPVASWRKLTPNGICGSEVAAHVTYSELASCGDYLIWCYGMGSGSASQKIWYSNNGGKTWSGKSTAVTEGVSSLSADKFGNIVYQNPSTSNKKFYYGTLLGAHSQSTSVPPSVTKVIVPLSEEGNWVAGSGSSQGPWVTRDKGRTWSKADPTIYNYASSGYTNELGVTALVGGSSSQKYLTKSDDNGASWTQLTLSSLEMGSSGSPITYHSPSGNWIMTNYSAKLIRRSPDLVNWYDVMTVPELMTSSNKALASGGQLSVMISRYTRNGTDWSNVIELGDLPRYSDTRRLCYHKGSFYAVDSKGYAYILTGI